MTRREIAIYPYVDENDALLSEAVRFEPKDFRQRRYDAEGKPIWNLNGVRRVPYRLPQLIAGKERDEVVIAVEGEKDVDALRPLGFCVTTSACGSSWAWTAEFAEHFRGAIVVIVADNDDAGRDAARVRAGMLLGVAREVHIIENLPDVPEKGDVSDLIAKGWTSERFVALFESATLVEPPTIEDGAALLGLVEEFVRRFVVVSNEALLAIGLWVLHTYAVAAAEATPYLSIGSPQRQCGKTRLLEVLKALVARPFYTARTSAAALVRKVAKDACTLLLDETDAVFTGVKDYSEALRGILNAGALRGGVATLCVGRDHEVQDFPVFGPKAIAGIGRLPDTIADRSIRVELSRKKHGESVERFRLRKVDPEATCLRARIEQWAKQNLEALRAAEPVLPDELSDRAQDGWEPLLAIADLCGAGERARRAGVVLARATPEAEDVNERTLRDCKIVFDARAVDRLPTTELVAGLRDFDEGPYTSNRGREFDGNALAKRLRQYNIRPRDVRFEAGTRKGYLRSIPIEDRRSGETDFEENWERYSP